MIHDLYIPYMTPDEIEDEVKRTIDILAPDDGFVFFPSHNIQAGIDRMYQTVLKNRGHSA